MKLRLLVAVALIISACKPANESRWVFQASCLKPSTSQIRGRLWYTHGAYGSIDDLLDPQKPYSLITRAALDAGWEVELIGWPLPTREDLAVDGGAAYRTAFQRFVERTAARLPEVPRTVAGGSSFGGLHAVWISQAVHSDAMFANLTLTAPSVLSEYSGINTQAVDLQLADLPSSKNRWISYGSDDQRVAGSRTAQLIPDAHKYNGAHVATPSQMEDIICWIDLARR